MPNLNRLYIGMAITFVSLAALAGALIGQYGFGLYPCTLCLYQRVPYVVTALLGFAVAFGPLKVARASIYASAAVFLAGASIAAFHVGVEQGWWQGTESCGIDIANADIDAIRAQIMGAPRALCTDVAWSLFGVSMAGYNFVYSLALAVASFAAGKKKGL